MQVVEGLDKESGYTLKWNIVSSASTAVQMLSSGQLDVAQTGTPLALSAAAKDPDLRIVGFMNGATYTVVAPKDGGIKSIDDLKGKTIGVMALGSASHTMVRAAMKEAGLKEQDVKFVVTPVGAPMAEALNSGKVDAIAGWEGMWQSVSALTETPLVRVPTILTELGGDNVLVSTKEVIEERPEALKAYIENFYKMCAVAELDPERAVEDHWKNYPSIVPPAAQKDATLKNLSNWYKDWYSVCAMPSKEKGTVGVLSDDELTNLYDFYRTNGVVTEDVDISTVIDLSLTEEALDGLDLDVWAKEFDAS